MNRTSRACARTGLILLGALGGQHRALASSSFTLLGGLNLSSPRTALNSTLLSYTGMTMGFGFDINIKDHMYVEPEVLFVNRRYSEDYSIPTVMFPVLVKFENDFLMLGLGPYLGMLLGASSDTGAPATPDVLAMSSLDIGIVIDGGIKVPLTPRISGFADLRVSRALNEAYGGVDAFYWGQIQGYVGVQLKLGRVHQRDTYGGYR